MFCCPQFYDGPGQLCTRGLAVLSFPSNEKLSFEWKKKDSLSPILCITDDEPDNKKAKSEDQTQVASAAAAAVGMVPAAIPGAVPMMPMMPVPGMPVPHGFPQVPFGQPIPGGDN